MRQNKGSRNQKSDYGIYWYAEKENTKWLRGQSLGVLLLNRSPTTLASGILVFSAQCTKIKPKLCTLCFLTLSPNCDIINTVKGRQDKCSICERLERKKLKNFFKTC